jgi:diguanylate cyclase (GGDEF)-like protein
MAFEDALTRVGNRRLVDDVLQRLAAGEERTSVALLDIDRLKELNDSEGHAAGDAALRAVADALSQSVLPWPRAAVGRLGGDEFCVVLPGCTAAAARRMLDAALDLLRQRGGPTVSLGVACVDAGPWESRDLLAAADEQLYQAKGWAHRSSARAERRRPPRPSRRHVVRANPG